MSGTVKIVREPEGRDLTFEELVEFVRGVASHPATPGPVKATLRLNGRIKKIECTLEIGTPDEMRQRATASERIDLDQIK